MLYFQDDGLHFDAKRCCQCGTCLAICKRKALSALLEHDGTYKIKLDAQKCNACGKCVACCPAHDLPNLKVSETDWELMKGTFLGNARNFEVNTSASSGGVARTLLINALNRSFCERAYCVVGANHYPWAEGQFLKKGATLPSISNSMYLPIMVNKNLEKIPEISTILVVGTNCQLIGVEHFYHKSPIRLIKVALLCKQQKTIEFTRFIARRLGLEIDFDVPVKYRGHGWPGQMKIAQKELSWEDAAALPYKRKLWMIPGCRFCGHPLGSNADITLADPWGIATNEQVGKTLVFVRTELGKAILELCVGDIILKEIDISRAKASVDWEGIKRKQRIIPFYLKDEIQWNSRVIVKIADFQRHVYERILERVRLPRSALRTLNRIPFFETLL